jgi:hypothetical protein
MRVAGGYCAAGIELSFREIVGERTFGRRSTWRGIAATKTISPRRHRGTEKTNSKSEDTEVAEDREA